MPELPDVEGFRRLLRRHAAGKRVAGVEARRDILRNTSPQGLGRALSGGRVENPERHGKWLICPVDGAHLLLHFGMTGELVWSGSTPERHDHDRLFLRLEDGELRYRAQRKLGGVWLARRGQDVEDVTGPLGPDALRVSSARFRRLLRDRRGGVKPTLMDQETMAGLGNVTVDEILWRARLDPRRTVRDLEEDELERLERTTKDVLRTAVEHGRVPTSSSWLTSQRGEDDPTCPHCGASLETPTVGGRTTYICPQCQG